VYDPYANAAPPADRASVPAPPPPATLPSTGTPPNVPAALPSGPTASCTPIPAQHGPWIAAGGPGW